MAPITDKQQAYCEQCKFTVVWPTSLSVEDKSRIAEFRRADLGIEGVRFINQAFGMELKEAKGLLYHITRVKNACHRCKQPIQGEISVCANCNSVNLDW